MNIEKGSKITHDNSHGSKTEQNGLRPIPETVRTFHWIVRLWRAVMFHQKKIGVEAVMLLAEMWLRMAVFDEASKA